MAALLQGLKNMFTRKTNARPTLENAYNAQNTARKTEQNVLAAKARICGLLDEKIRKGGNLTLLEAEYMIRYCNKSRDEVYSLLNPLFKVTNRSPAILRKQVNDALSGKTSPISPLTYPNEKPTPTVENSVGGGKRKTRKQKRRHTKKRKHTRKH